MSLTDELNKVVGQVEQAVVAKVIRKPKAERDVGTESEVVFGLERDFAINADELIVRELQGSADVGRWQAGALARPTTDDPLLRINFEKGRFMDVHRGAGVILGAADTGKSLLSRFMQQQHPSEVALLGYREPEDSATWIEAKLLAAIVSEIKAGKKVIIVDSLRTFFYESTGATGKGGVNMGIFKPLTVFDQLARKMNIALFFCLNPMTEDEDSLKFYLGATSGAVSYSIATPRPKELRFSSRWSKNRDFMNLSYEPAAQGRTTSPMKANDGPNRPTDLTTDSIADLWNFN